MCDLFHGLYLTPLSLSTAEIPKEAYSTSQNAALFEALRNASDASYIADCNPPSRTSCFNKIGYLRSLETLAKHNAMVRLVSRC